MGNGRHLSLEGQVTPVIQPDLQEVAIAAVNADSVVISGKRSTIRLVVAQLEAMGIKTTPLQVSHAFHSPLIEPMLEEFARVANEVTYSPPKINLISNVTGELADAEVTTPEYWCRHVRCSVQFAAGMEALYRAGYEVFVECAPKPILLGMGRKCLPEGVGRWLPSLHPGQEDWQQILQSLVQLYVEGVQVDWLGFDRGLCSSSPATADLSIPAIALLVREGARLAHRGEDRSISALGNRSGSE